jgi:hypothetical protein
VKDDCAGTGAVGGASACVTPLGSEDGFMVVVVWRLSGSRHTTAGYSAGHFATDYDSSMLGLQAMPAASGPEPGLERVLRAAAGRQGEVSRPAKGPEIGDPEHFS